MNPQISVLMSVYNDENYITKAIESILSQSFRNFEFIIINDGSTDNSLNIIKKYAHIDNRIKVINQKNIGLTKSLNKGLKILKGKYIARQDANDYSEKNRLGEQYQFLEQNNHIAAIFTWHKIIDSFGNYIADFQFSSKSNILKKNILIGRNIYAHGSVMIRSNILKRCGGYDNSKRIAQDYYLWKNLVNQGYILSAVEKFLYNWRLQKTSISINNGDATPELEICHRLQDFYFRIQDKRNIYENTVYLIRYGEIKFKEILKCLIALQPLNYKWIFKHF